MTLTFECDRRVLQVPALSSVVVQLINSQHGFYDMFRNQVGDFRLELRCQKSGLSLTRNRNRRAICCFQSLSCRCKPTFFHQTVRQNSHFTSGIKKTLTIIAIYFCIQVAGMTRSDHRTAPDSSVELCTSGLVQRFQYILRQIPAVRTNSSKMFRISTYPTTLDRIHQIIKFLLNSRSLKSTLSITSVEMWTKMQNWSNGVTKGSRNLLLKCWGLLQSISRERLKLEASNLASV